jgi:cell fate regulator YaaT (PSP1 superfamily)
MCCLTYEHEYYEKIQKNFPKVGKRVVTKRGEGKVVRLNVLKETITVFLDSGEEVEVDAGDIKRASVSQKKRKKE